MSLISADMGRDVVLHHFRKSIGRARLSADVRFRRWLRTLACVGLLVFLAVFGIAEVQAKGIVPGTFRIKLHETIPLLEVDDSPAEFRRVPDATKLFNAPLVDQAGTHADLSVMSVLKIDNIQDVLNRSEVPQDVFINLPTGVTANLGSIPTCKRSAFESTVYGNETPRCSPASQVGVVGALFGGQFPDRTYPLYKIYTVPGWFAAFGFPYELINQRVPVVLYADLRTDSDYGMTLAYRSIFETFIPAPFITFWGAPGDPIHDAERWDPQQEDWGASLGKPGTPLIANAADCGSGVLEAKLRMNYWQEHERWLPEDPEDFAYRSFIHEPTRCENLDFDPRIEFSASTHEVDSSSGLSLGLELPRDHALNSPDVPPLKEAIITLPAGLSVNPATVNGLAGCTPGQIGLLGTDFAPPNPIRFADDEAHCPDASKIGVGVVDTPLVEEPSRATVFFATPYHNPFDSLLALYLVIENEAFTIKLAAKVDVDQTTGRLVAKADWLPQLPVKEIDLRLFDGPRAPLATPQACGEAAAAVRLVPWSALQSGVPTTIESRMTFSPHTPNAPCGGSTGSLPMSMGLDAGTRDPVAAESSPFILHVDRANGGQEPRTISATLPRGLAVNTQAAAYCSEADIARAGARGTPGQGIVEQRSPSCPVNSRIGSLLLGTGTGSIPLFTTGTVYWAGPYKGAPFSLVSITPVLAGGAKTNPLFDLGVTVVRIAVTVDPKTGQISATSDPVPQAVAGIPMKIKNLWLVLDRAGFIHNPSSCNEKRIEARLEGWSGGEARLVNRFQVGGCQRLGFRPRFRVYLLRGRRLGQHPKLRATLSSGLGDSGLARARITLPSSESLGRTVLKKSCPEVKRVRHGCPSRSIVGRVTAWSPFLDSPLHGLVYLTAAADGSSSLTLAFSGQTSLKAVGRIRQKGKRVQITFIGLPDIPFSRLAISLRGGRKGLLVNQRDLCSHRFHFAGRFTAHNGKVQSRGSPLKGVCRASKHGQRIQSKTSHRSRR